MKGRVIKVKEKSYKYIVDVGDDPKTGKRKRKSKGGFIKERDCQKALNEVLMQLQKNNYIDENKMSLADYLDYWLGTYAKLNVAPSTYVRYKLSIKDISNYIGNIALSQLKPLHIQKLYVRLLEEKKQSKCTVLKTHRTLHLALKQAIAWQMIYSNPTDFVTAPRPDKVEMKVWTNEQAKDFLNRIGGESIHIPVAIALHTGAREGEICAIKWENIDLVNKTLVIRHSLPQKKTDGELKISTTKTRKSRTISLGTEIVNTLKTWQTKQKENKLFYGNKYIKSGYVCTWEDGRLISPHYVCDRFPDLIEKVNNDYRVEIKKPKATDLFMKIRFHDLRHTHATILLQKGVNIKVVSERLGHSKTAIDLDTYSHVLPNMQREAAQKIDEALS